MLQLDRQTISVAIRFLKAKTPEQRAAVDLDTHYTKVKNQVQTRNLVALENLYIGRYCYIKKNKKSYIFPQIRSAFRKIKWNV